VSVYKAHNSPYFHFDFQIQRHRFHGSTGCTNRREAEAYEHAERHKRRAELKLSAPGAPLTVDLAVDRFWIEVAQHYATADTVWTYLCRITDYFGPGKPLTEIRDDDIARWVAWRRGQKAGRRKDAAGKPRLVSAGAVNRSTVELLRTIFHRARRAWRYRFDDEPNWGEHLLPEPEERVRELRQEEAAAIEASIRFDYGPFLEFARATGWRLGECLLRWDQVNWAAGQITRTGKGGRLIVTPITPTIAGVLTPLIGHHPEWVFTYVARKTAAKRKKGRRYPITYSGAKTRWRRDRKAARLQDFRFHDFRHDLGTKLLRQTGNLKLVQKALSHARIETTTKYAHVLDKEVAAALEGLAESRNKSRTTKKKSA
jgi:integrase